ncbi:MAG: hypothetical protein L6R42_006289 [Xanthoria sp. 1 TBL-2021]|nr:MAG: hypothetical protein L6R42_006289 [Xanthoria sp. 1 TBL-2021]
MSLSDHRPYSTIPTPTLLPLPTKIATMILQSQMTFPALTSASAFTTSAVPSAQMSVYPSNIPSSPTHGSGPGTQGGECQLLGEASIFIQGALGGLALLSLVYKRWRERPQRPLKIWFFDVSKQVVGSVLLHIANLGMSLLSSGQLTITPKTDTGEYRANPCSFYLLNLAIDTTIGIPILLTLLRLLTYGFSLTPLGDPPESIQSGHYGRPAKASWWLKQSFIYFIGLLGMKACVFAIFQLCPWLIRVGDWALKWTEGNATVQVFFVMLFFPVVMNALQYYIIDGFIKNQKPADPEADYDNAGADDDRRAQRPRAHAEDEHNRDGEDGLGSRDEAATASDVENKPLLAGGVVKLKIDPKRLNEYDPSTDGETSPAQSEIRRRNSPGGIHMANEREDTAGHVS